MADEMEVITAKETKKYVSLTLSVKREIIQEVENGGKSQRNLAKQFGVSRTTIAQIVKDKDKILRQLEKSPESAYKRVKTEKYESINRLVIASLQEYIRRNQANPTGTWIKKEALFFAENEGIETFTASNGWLHRFLKRYHIRLSNCARPTAPTDEIVEELDMTEMTEESFSEHNGDAIEEFESEMDLCRLCGCKSSFDALCSLRDPELLIEMKLEKTFNMRLNNDKLLPQNICFQCISSLESSMAFLEMAEETQATLERNLNDQLQHCEPSIILENEIKVEEILTTSFEEVPCSSYQVLASPPRPRKRSRVRSAIPTKTHNPVMKMEDIFVKELTEGTFVSSPEMLEGLTEDEQNADGTINETGMYKLSHLGWFNYSWKCVQCHSVMETRTDLENHFKKEHKQHRISYACSDCKATFKGYLAFINHVTESHRPYMKFFCDLCCDFRWNLLDLYRHREDRHPKLRNTCLYCGKLYDCGFSLKQHIGVHLNLPEDQLFKCDLCNHQCHTKYLIKQHITLNHAKSHGELVCEQCGKICKRLSDMRSHQLVHTQERPFACNLCDLKFKCPKQLRCHKRTHFPRLLTEECSVCHKKFLTKGKLERHFLIHTNTFNYTCEFCGRKFKHSSGFNTHRRIHTGERPYVCSYENCGQKFIDWPNMNKHMKSKHQVDNSSRKKKIIFDHMPDGDILL